MEPLQATQLYVELTRAASLHDGDVLAYVHARAHGCIHMHTRLLREDVLRVKEHALQLAEPHRRLLLLLPAWPQRRHRRLWASTGTQAIEQPLFGTQAARALLSGPQRSPKQAGGLLERRAAAWAAASQATL